MADERTDNTWRTDTWRELIAREMSSRGESWADIVACTLTGTELDEMFDSGFGCSEGKPFTAWTKEHVYFPACYDGSEWCASVPRDPCLEATEHVGRE
jgi:hypothetical protein